MIKKNKLYAARTGEQAEAEKQLARAARAAYMRRYRRKHPEKIKAINEAYWCRRAIREARETEGKGAAVNDV